MYSSKSSKRQSGFTLVELLIVAIILAILAAIIVPQFASTTVDAQESALRANAAGMRSAIDLYRQQHGEYPGRLTAVSGASCTATKGTGLADSESALVSQLSLYTDAAGAACSQQMAGLYPFGPYIQDETIPTNPITGDDTVIISTAGDLNLSPATGGGWQYDVVSGKFIVNDDGLDSQNVAYSTY